MIKIVKLEIFVLDLTLWFTSIISFEPCNIPTVRIKIYAILDSIAALI
jgi:hypothetical protein